MKTEVFPAGARPIGPYSPGVSASSMVFCSGQLGTDPKSGELALGVAAQTAAAIANMKGVLEAAGLGLGNVVKVTVFMADLSEFDEMNREYSKHFKPPYPARSTVGVAALPKSARVEIECIASRE